MKKLNLKIKDMPYAAEEALNRLRVNIKFCGKNTKKIVITIRGWFPHCSGGCGFT